MQRFDFLVRTRPLSDEERQAESDSPVEDAKEPSSYPQREAVLFAIKGLSEPSS